MSDLTRRTLIGTAGALGAGAALAGTAAADDDTGGGGKQETAVFDTAPARDALRRLLPRHAGQFRLHALRGGTERFEVGGRAGRIEVAGTSPRCC
ncbi:alpha-N-acetylglucosaminidase N-terminal domain-containing protein [Streptomyces sp. M19]